ncbi:MAG: DUF1285 domain-containing protein [Parahaliea sp.]
MPASDDKNETFATVERQLGARRDLDNPPLHRWHPALSGDIDIVIRADGSWWHEGEPIVRPEIVRLFSKLLRREDDGHYYLVTPGEKWRLRVEAYPLLVTGMERNAEGVFIATLNTGKEVALDSTHPLFLDSQHAGVAGVGLDHGLRALCTRAAWYRLVEEAEEESGIPVVRSGDCCWPLLPAP